MIKMEGMQSSMVGNDSMELNKDTVSTQATAHKKTPLMKYERRIRAMGPWDQVLTDALLAGPPALPMPVKIAERKSLSAIYHHLSMDGQALPLPQDVAVSIEDISPSFQLQQDMNNVPFIEYEKGIVYEDHRLDLCKMVVGPPNIEALLDSLENNTFIKHFLLGNNIIGHVGAKRIAKFIKDHPDRMDTWYLAGNCIDATGFRLIVDGLIASVATNVWFKRNPLTIVASDDIARLIIQSPVLRTLDLDQTGLTDAGVAKLFDQLANSGNKLHSLQHVYLNGNGIGSNGAKSIARYLASASSQIRSLYLSNNPLGDEGISYLVEGLESNCNIQRVMLSSIGMTSQGAAKLLRSLTGHETLLALDIGQSFATEDLKSRFNWIDDDAVPAISDFIRSNVSTRYLQFGPTSISLIGINHILSVVEMSDTLCWLELDTIESQADEKLDWTKKRLKKNVECTLSRNAAMLYNTINYREFETKFKRQFTGPEEDVRKIDSMYRTRDVGMARKGLKTLDKLWNEDDSTLTEVMNWG